MNYQSGQSRLHYATLSPKYTRPSNKSSITTHYQQPQPLGDRSNFMAAQTAFSNSQESITEQATSITQGHKQMALYNNTSTYLMSKSVSVSTATDLSDNIIYSDITDLMKSNNTHTIQTQTSNDIINVSPNIRSTNSDDLYATINRNTKKAKTEIISTNENVFSDNIFKFNKYANENSVNSCYSAGEINENEEFQHFDEYYMNRFTDQNPDYYDQDKETLNRTICSYSDHYLSCTAENLNSNILSPRNSNSLPNNNYNIEYVNLKASSEDGNFDVENANKNSSKLEYDMSYTNGYNNTDQQKLYFDDEFDHKESWQRSTSCKELCGFGYDYKKRTDFTLLEREFLTSDRIDSPVTHYDDCRRSLYVNTKNLSIDVNQDFQMPESKVYSSSYPGSTYNVVNQNKKRSQECEFNGSQDVSHDSYELLEKSEDDIYFKLRMSDEHQVRSCSLDSGNYIPTDDESTSERGYLLKYRSALDLKSKSAADIMNDIFLLDDPRDLPREKLCVKSDGSFYQHVKKSMGSRTSSQESQSDLYESKLSKSSGSSKKSKDSVYHTDSKKSKESLKNKYGSGYNSTSSPDSSPEEAFGFGELLNRNNYEMPTTTGKKPKSMKALCEESSRNSSIDSKSDYYDEQLADQQSFDMKELEGDYVRPKVVSHENLVLNSDALDHILDSQVYSSTFPSNNKVTKTSHVHSISLQNVEIERNAKTYSAFKAQISISSKPPIDNILPKKTHIWPEEIEGLQTEISGIERAKSFRKRSESENIFSFDKDKIESLTSESIAEKSRKSPEYPLTPELLSQFDKQKIDSPHCKPKMTSRKEELIAKTHFEEYNPKLLKDSNIQLPISMPYSLHATVERTKSDPNSLANRPRLTANSRRHTLMHQKSIDLTPADSSEEEYLYKQIPSAPPHMCKSHGSHFEIPSHTYDMPVPDLPILPRTGFELPPNFFFDRRNQKNQLKDEIPYVLHKRHIMNGTVPTLGEPKHRCLPKPKSPRSPKSPKPIIDQNDDAVVPDSNTAKGFLFTQNIDLSKVDPVTLEIDKTIQTVAHVSSPKRDISKQLDPTVLQALNSKLSQIESDSATSSKTDSMKLKKLDMKPMSYQFDPATIKKEAVMSGKPRVKPRSSHQVKNKMNIKSKNKTKTRITSFSSDDESYFIDSDDVFGSAEAMPTRMEFSPPQSRKEIEPILKHEYSKLSQAAWARGQTMSSTEIEGSPPQCRRLADLENRYHLNKLDTAYTSSELRRISERSISIPSSEDDGGGSTMKAEPTTQIYNLKEGVPLQIVTTNEIKSDTEAKKKSRNKMLEEIIDSSIIMRPKGHAPVLFAHARLNLSEGSAFASLQRQKATQDSPGRRAKSLDTPVISMHRLPPINAFSSKDDTVGFEEEKLDDILESKKTIEHSLGEQNFIILEDDELELLDRLKYIEKITLQGVKIKEKRKSRTKLKSGDQLILDIPRYKFEPFSSGNSSLKTSPAVSRASSVESQGRLQTGENKKQLPIKKNSKEKLRVPTDFGTLKRSGSKERSKSLEKMEPRKASPRERKSTPDESDLERAKRKERQQKLYETAMKQTISKLSPVNDQMPQFPILEDSISVKSEADKITIDSELNIKIGDHVLIAKSPRKLDCSIAKISRSFEHNKSIEKIDKASRSFEDRNKSFEDSEKSDNDIQKSKSSGNLSKKDELKQIIEGSVVHKKFQGKSKSLDKKCGEYQYLNNESKARSLDFENNASDLLIPTTKFNIEKNELCIELPIISVDRNQRKISDGSEKTGSLDVSLMLNDKQFDKVFIKERRALSEDFIVEMDMQDIISERRNLDLLKRSLPCTEVTDDKNEREEIFVAPGVLKSSMLHCRIPTIECEEPSIEEDISENRQSILCTERSRSEDTGSWGTLECEEYVGGTYESGIDTKHNELMERQTTFDGSKNVSNEINSKAQADIPSKSIFDNKTNTEENQNRLNRAAIRRGNYLKLSIEKSRSSDTASSMEKDPSPVRGNADRQDSSNKEKSSIDEESSVSCSISRPLGISQDYVDFNDQNKCRILRDAMMRGNETDETQNVKKYQFPLEKQLQLDQGSSSEQDNDLVEERIARLLQRDESESSSGSGGFRTKSSNSKPNRESVHKKVLRAVPFQDLSSIPHEELQAAIKVSKNLNTSSGGSLESKSSIESKESRGSFETESSSGSLGVAQRQGEIPQSTWKPFLIESSGGSSAEENWVPLDHDTYENFESGDMCHVEREPKIRIQNDDIAKESDSDVQDDLSDFPATFYPEMTSSLIGPNPADILGYGTGFAIGRTLSRISERSTNSEKSSAEEEKTNSGVGDELSVHDEEKEDESQASNVSSELHSNSHQAYVSDADRRTSAEMPEIPSDAERLAEIYRINAVKAGRFSVTQVDDAKKLKEISENPVIFSETNSSQEEDWPLPEIPPEIGEDIFYIASDSRPVPKSFCWRNSTAGVQSQDSEQWPSPPSSAIDTSVIIEDLQTFYLSEAQIPTQVVIDSFAEHSITFEDDEPDYAEVTDIVPDPPKRDYECMILSFKKAGCFRTTVDICSGNKSAEVLDPPMDFGPDKVIVCQPMKSPPQQSPLLSDEDFMNDDVFLTVKIEISPDDTKTENSLQQYRCSNNSDTSIDDMLSASCATYLDDSSIRLSLEPRRLSNESCKKCSHSSHSEEETSSFGTDDLDGTVKMGIPFRKCTHSSHSEDTSIGLSLSEWSTGTNTVRQYANLSGSDSLSAVSNHSNGVKSEKSNNTKSSVSSINKSTESLNEKSASLSAGKNHRYSFDNLSDGPKYDGFSNSDTDKFTSSGTNDESTLTLTEMVQSITEWSTSTSHTLVDQDFIKQQQLADYKMDKSRSSVEYVVLKPPVTVKRASNDKHNIPSVHVKPNSRQNTPPESIETCDSFIPKSTERPMKLPPKIVQVHEKSKAKQKPQIPPPPMLDDSPDEAIGEPIVNRRKAFELMSQRYQSQEIPESGEKFNKKLYSSNEKLSERYQSQEFLVPQKPPRESKIQQEKSMSKHYSYDDKTLSKSQIRQYKSSRIKQSQSFHEHMVATDLNKIDEEKLSPSTKTATSPASTTTTQNSETDNSSPLITRPEKLSKCSPYYSSSLSSDSPPVPNGIILMQKPPRKISLPRNILPKSPPSGNDTDSSLDLRQQHNQVAKLKKPGYRKKKPIPKRVRPDVRLEESSECSECYLPEIHSSSSDNMSYLDKMYPDFQEEPEPLLEDFDEEEDDCRYAADDSKIGSYPITYSTKFETLDMSENVDEMGFPKYDRLRHLMYKSGTPSPPIKPVRQKKKQLKEIQHDTFYNETKSGVGLSDDVYYSSEDSSSFMTTGFMLPNAHYKKNVEIPYPDFLSDYENENDIVTLPTKPSCSYTRNSNTPYDIKNVPSSIFDEDSEEDLSYN